MSVVYQYQQPNSPVPSQDNFRKKLFILLGLLFACAIIIGVVVALGSSRSVQRATYEESAENFLTAVRDKNNGALEELTVLSSAPSGEEALTESNKIEELRGSVDLKSCVLQSASSQDATLLCSQYEPAENEDKAPQVSVELSFNAEGKVSDIKIGEEQS